MATSFYNTTATTTTGSNYYWTTNTTGGNSINTINTQQWTYTQPTIYPLDADYINELIKKYIKEENKDMATDFSFGSYNTQNIRLSLYGMAVKNKAGKWVSYDIKTHSLIDVEVFNIEIDASKVFFKLPKATDKVLPGDIILHNGKPVFVEVVRPDGKFEVIDPSEGTAVIILPLKSPFGFNYIPVIVSITDFLPEANEDSPFGKLLPLMLAGGDNNNLALALMMQNKDIDPMMLMMMCGKGDMNPLLLMMMMDKKKGKGNHKYKDLDDLLDHRRASYGPGIEDDE